ncbi:MAG TPA: glycosyltransferase 87 family protein [Ktedonobacterales bacterium]|nr:glycosyltransferase 87 family protein [Ktedonobacterales bacterium]
MPSLVKPTFVVLVLYALWRHEWRVAVAAGAIASVATLVSLVTVGPAIRNDFLTVAGYWSSPGFVTAPKRISLLGVIE